MNKRILKRVLKLASERIGDDIFSEFACHSVRGAAREILIDDKVLYSKQIEKIIINTEEYVDWFKSQKPKRGGLHSEFTKHPMWVFNNTIWWTYYGAERNVEAMEEKRRFLNYLIKQIS